jgi:RecA-family ATPase
MHQPQYARLDDEDDEDGDHGGRSQADQAKFELRRIPPVPSHDQVRQFGKIITPDGSTFRSNAFTSGKKSVQIGATYPSFDFFVRDLGITVGPPNLLIAMGYSGKTFLAQDLAVCAATGSLFLNQYKVKEGKTLHLDYDQGTEQTEVRYMRLFKGRGLGEKAMRHPIDFTRPTMKLDEKGAEQELTEAIRGYSFCIIDALRPAISADENDSRVREPLNMLGRVSEATRCAFLLIHHTGKNDGGDDRMIGRGSSAIFDAAGTVLTLRRKPSGDESFTYHLSQSKSRTGRLSTTLVYKLEDDGNYVEAINQKEFIRLVPTTSIDESTANDDKRILDALRGKGEVHVDELMKLAEMNKSRFLAALKRLTEEPKRRVERRLKGKKAYYVLSAAHVDGWDAA